MSGVAQRRRCAFCGGPANSREHVFPDWMHKLYPVQQVNINCEHSLVATRQYTERASNRRVRLVCARCNNGWMSDIERAAKPVLEALFQGQRVLLRRSEQTLIATWFTKTALVEHLTQPIRDPITHEHREYIYNVRQPPPESHVWLGTADFLPNSRGRSFFQGIEFKSTLPEGPRTVHTYTAVFR